MAGNDPGAKRSDRSRPGSRRRCGWNLPVEQDGFEVVLTRRVDTFVARRATAIANRKAPISSSIHANASTNSPARGIETYFLNLTANPDAEMVASHAERGRRAACPPPDIARDRAHNKIHESPPGR
jgi:N-acetylmuramoyl-L-alanine amidase